MLKLVTLLLSTFVVHLECLSPTDFAKTGYGNNLFASKTSYFWLHPETPSNQDALYTVTMENRTCRALQFNMVSRHAARYTSADDMRLFTSLQNKLIPLIGNERFNFIKTWRNTYPEEKDNLATELGREEMKSLGSKYGRELYSLFQNGGISRVKLAATNRVRTQTSGTVFLKSLAESVGSLTATLATPNIRNDILRFYSSCENFQKMTKDPAFLQEMIAFQKGPQFQAMIRDIETRLHMNATLSVDDVKMIYLLCATELAIINQSEWCTLQSDQNREVLEYENDIEDYYSRLYGYPIIAKMTCPLVQDIFTELDSAIKEHSLGNNFTTAVLQFGHSDTIVGLYAALDLFKDPQPLRADNYIQMQNRHFNDAKVAPFSAHLAFVLYNCGGTSLDDYAIQLLVNGEPTNIPACNSAMCRYGDVRAAYGQAVDMCNYDNVCQYNTPVVG